LLTNGGDEAIQLLFQTYVDPGDQIILLRPSYAMYRFYAGLAAAEVCSLDYGRPGFAFPMAALLAAIRPTTRLILLANPNNPTGGCIGSADIECILRAAPAAAVLVDEAYFDFCGTTALPLLAACPNLFVCRTFSKAHGLAALRLGCLFSQPGNIAVLRRAQSPYSVNLCALLAARASLRDPAYLRAYVEEVRAARAFAAAGLRACGFRVHANCANFLLFEAGQRAPALCAALAARGILLRDCGRDIPGALRLTLGTRTQMETFLSELRAL
jgi:histidinol-phosphate aminotransferase